MINFMIEQHMKEMKEGNQKKKQQQKEINISLDTQQNIDIYQDQIIKFAISNKLNKNINIILKSSSQQIQEKGQDNFQKLKGQMYYDMQYQVTYSKEERKKIKDHFNNYEFQKVRQYNRFQDYEMPIYPKSLIRQILSSMRNEDGFLTYMLMGFMNKKISDMIKDIDCLKHLEEQRYEKDKCSFIPYSGYINIVKQMNFFQHTAFDFKTPMYMKDLQGNIIHKFPQKQYQFQSKYYQGDKDFKNSSFRYFENLFYDNDIGYTKLQYLRKQRLQLEDLKKDESIDGGKLLFEDEFEREERLYDLDYAHNEETRKSIIEYQKAEMMFQEKLYDVYQILFGDSNKYTVNQRKKQFVLIMTYFLYDPNDKLLNDKMVPFYCIFPDHLEYQTIVQPLNPKSSMSYKEIKDPPILATYNKLVYQLDNFLKKYPGFENSFNFQQNYSMLLYKTKAYDKCIDFIVKTGMSKLPNSIYYTYNSYRDHDSITFTLKEFWYPLFQRISPEQLGAAFDRNETLCLRFLDTLYNLAQTPAQSAEIVHRVGESIRYTPDREEFIQLNWRAIGIDPKSISAHASLAKHYLDKNFPDLFLVVMESFCEFKSNELLLLEGMEKYFLQSSLQWLSKCNLLIDQ